MKKRKTSLFIILLFSLCFISLETHFREAESPAKINPVKLSSNKNNESKFVPLKEAPSGTKAEGTYYYHVEVSQDVMIEDIATDINLEAFDDYDGDLTQEIQTNDLDEYQVNVPDLYIDQRTLGEYKVQYVVSDSAGNTTELMIIVVVEDKNPPEILPESVLSYEVDIDNMNLTNEDILAGVVADDEHDRDNVVKEITEGDLENLDQTIDVPQPFTVTITDQSGNATTQEVNVTLKDKTKPVITTTTDAITTSYFANATVESLIEGISCEVTDNYDKEIAYTLENDTYTENKNTKGTYSVDIVATDKSGNKETKTISIEVNDKIPPVFYLDISKVFVSKEVQLTQTDFLTLLKNNGKIYDDNYEYYVLEDTYTESYDQEGEYTYRCRVSYDEDHYDDFKFNIKVLTEVKPPHLSFFQSFIINTKKIANFVWEILKWPFLRIKKLF